jgi:hypothetical protein
MVGEGGGGDSGGGGDGGGSVSQHDVGEGRDSGDSSETQDNSSEGGSPGGGFADFNMACSMSVMSAFFSDSDSTSQDDSFDTGSGADEGEVGDDGGPEAELNSFMSEEIDSDSEQSAQYDDIPYAPVDAGEFVDTEPPQNPGQDYSTPAAVDTGNASVYSGEHVSGNGNSGVQSDNIVPGKSDPGVSPDSMNVTGIENQPGQDAAGTNSQDGNPPASSRGEGSAVSSARFLPQDGTGEDDPSHPGVGGRPYHSDGKRSEEDRSKWDTRQAEMGKRLGKDTRANQDGEGEKASKREGREGSLGNDTGTTHQTNTSAWNERGTEARRLVGMTMNEGSTPIQGAGKTDTGGFPGGNRDKTGQQGTFLGVPISEIGKKKGGSVVSHADYLTKGSGHSHTDGKRSLEAWDSSIGELNRQKTRAEAVSA